eukprot:CAMPEP_0119565890 /NCGR_PEP_ID=MMETSP1352-20130426/31433_1 /TAXON_ID=265584 /ORGANISM="Stauroneis constricta, Strain CCMP1120" /LENGTH=540 /DNA_ID=CAMNT_0007614905 /DNA_START=59 /DNA_END=1678 /DNA_ORIENTATION=-
MEEATDPTSQSTNPTTASAAKSKDEWKRPFFLTLALVVAIVAAAVWENTEHAGQDPFKHAQSMNDAMNVMQTHCWRETDLLCDPCSFSIRTRTCRLLYTTTLMSLLGENFVDIADPKPSTGWKNETCYFRNTIKGLDNYVSDPLVTAGDDNDNEQHQQQQQQVELNAFVALIVDKLRPKIGYWFPDSKTQDTADNHDWERIAIKIVVAEVIRFFNARPSFRIWSFERMSIAPYKDIQLTEQVLNAFSNALAHQQNGNSNSNFDTILSEIVSDYPNIQASINLPYSIDSISQIEQLQYCKNHREMIGNGTRRRKIHKNLSNQVLDKYRFCMVEYNKSELLLSDRCSDCMIAFQSFRPITGDEKDFYDFITLMFYLIIFVSFFRLGILNNFRRNGPKAVIKLQKFRLAELDDPILSSRPKRAALEKAKKEGITDENRLAERQEALLEEWRLRLENLDVKKVANMRFQKRLGKFRNEKWLLWVAFVIVDAIVCWKCNFFPASHALALAAAGPASTALTYFIPAWNEEERDTGGDDMDGLTEPL